jgi:methionine synthase II (cobalamin-independent)
VLNPDCGLARLPRYLGFAKLRALVEGTRRVREELGGRAG